MTIKIQDFVSQYNMQRNKLMLNSGVVHSLASEYDSFTDTPLGRKLLGAFSRYTDGEMLMYDGQCAAFMAAFKAMAGTTPHSMIVISE